MGNLPLTLTGAIERPMPVKRPFESADDSPPIDVKKLKIGEELKLIDINNDCLWHTFEFLDADDLVRIAEAHARFIPVAISVFQRLYRKKMKLIVPCQPGSIDSYLCPADENIEALFRHFGHLISNVLVKFFGKKHLDIGALLQEYSADSLIKLDLAFLDENDFQNNIKPFPKLERLRIYKSLLNKNVSQQDIWFQNIQYLELVYVSLSHPELLEVNFPHLNVLKICNRKSETPIKTIREMLRKNSQLKSLTLCAEYDRDFVESLSQNVPGLEVLQLWAPADRFSSFHDSKIHFGSVKKFTLNACSSRGDFLVNVPFAFDALEELTFDGFTQFKGLILDFVKQYTMVKSLKLVPHVDDWHDLMLDDLRNILDALPRLTDLEIRADTFVCHDVIEVLKENKQLNNVNLVFMEMPWCANFQNGIQKQWNLIKQVVKIHNSSGNSTSVQFCLKRKN